MGQESKPVVLSIAGSDSGGGAGIQADLLTFNDFRVHGITLLTVITAQNSTKVTDIFPLPEKLIFSQAKALADDLLPKSIKIGALGNVDVMRSLNKVLTDLFQNIPIILDPVMVTTSGVVIMEEEAISVFKNIMLAYATIITPNIPEAEILVGSKINSSVDVVTAAHKLLSLGPKSVLLKGGHGNSPRCDDYFTDGKTKFWVSTMRQPGNNNHGSGCTLSSAIASCLGLGYNMTDAIVIAKKYITQGVRTSVQIGTGPGPVTHYGYPHFDEDLPILTYEPIIEGQIIKKIVFPTMQFDKENPYVIIGDISILKKVLDTGVRVVQLRLKNIDKRELEQQIKEALKICRQHANSKHIKLFINDHWELAIQCNAIGINLSLDDITNGTVDFDAIKGAGLYLGICGINSLANLAQIGHVQPSYLGVGPVFKDWTGKGKSLTLETSLRQMCMNTAIPIVADGISLAAIQINICMQCGVKSIAILANNEYASQNILEYQKIARELIKAELTPKQRVIFEQQSAISIEPQALFWSADSKKHAPQTMFYPESNSLRTIQT